MRISKVFYALMPLLLSGLVLGQSLGPDYLYGRITGGTHLVNSLALDSNFANVSSLRFGQANVSQTDVQFTTLGAHDSSVTQLGIVPTSLHYEGIPDAGQRVDIDVRTGNLSYWNLDGTSKGGFQSPFDNRHSAAFKHRFMGREAHIDVRPDQYEVTFRNGPLLNEGQYAHTLELSTSFYDFSKHSPKSFDLNYAPSYGIARWLQWSGMVNMYASENGIDPSVDMGLEVRRFGFWLAGDIWSGAANFVDLYHANSTTWTVKAGTILGRSTRTFPQVRGNWDHFFNAMAGPQQLVLESWSHGDFKSDPIWREANAQALVGVVSFLTLGANINWNADKYQGRDFARTRFVANLSNIAPRTDRPSEIPAIEYRYGYLPKRGEFLLQTSWELPWTVGGELDDASLSDNFPVKTDPQYLMDYARNANLNPQPGTDSTTYRVKLLVGAGGPVFINALYQYYSGNVSQAGSTCNSNVSKVSAGVGLGFDAFIGEAGLSGNNGIQGSADLCGAATIAQKRETQFGPAYLKLLYKF